MPYLEIIHKPKVSSRRDPKIFRNLMYDKESLISKQEGRDDSVNRKTDYLGEK